MAVLAAVAVLGVLWVRRDNSLGRVRNAGVIRIGYAIEAPYAFLRADGQVTGESPEVARAIAARLSIGTIRWRLANFEALLDELNAGNIDVIAAGMAITPEREKQAAFTPPTIQAAPALLVRRGNAHAGQTARALIANEAVRIAVVSGSIEEQALKRHGLTARRLLAAPDALTARRAVESGTVDALALTAPTLRWMVRTDPNPDLLVLTLVADEPLPAMRAGPAFRREDKALCEAWGEEQQRYLGTPEHLRLLHEFGFDAADLPARAQAPKAP